MLSKPHRQFCEGIVTGLSGVRAYKAAYPRCALNTAAVNASRLRARPAIREEIARLRAQANQIAGPAVLALAEKRIWLARVVRAQLALLDLEKDSDLLVSLEFEKGRKGRRVRKIRIVDKLAAIKLDTHLAGDDAGPGAPDPIRDSLAAMIVRVVEENSKPPAPPAPSSPASASVQTATSATARPGQGPGPDRNASPDPASPAAARSSESPPSATTPATPPSSPTTLPPLPHQVTALSFASPPSPAAQPPPATPVPPPDYTPLVFPSRPRFYPGPDYNPRRVRTISPLDPPLAYPTT